MRLRPHPVLIFLASAAACGTPDAEAGPAYTLRLTEYRLTNPEPAIVEAYEGTKEQMLEALVGEEARLDVSVAAEPGESVRIDQPPAIGTARIETGEDGRVEVTLDVDRFFSGTPLLIERCAPYVLVRSRMRVQGQVQVILKAVEVRDDSCTPA